MGSERNCIITGLTVRPLAASAVKGGIAVRAIDLFSDMDTAKSSTMSKAIGYDGQGLETEELLQCLEQFDPQREIPVIYGGGFEHAPQVLDRISKTRRLLGNTPESVSRVCDPKELFDALSSLDIPHPETQAGPPSNGGKWLQKSVGGSGGQHVCSFSEAGNSENSAVYYQELKKGRTVTATALAYRSGAYVIGYSEQWCSDSPHVSPFTYGGAVSIEQSELPERTRTSIERSATAIAKLFNLCGLITLDTIVDGDDWFLLEINPRPGATFELHEGEESYLRAHWDSFDGFHRKLNSGTTDGVYRAHSVVYAPKGLSAPENEIWSGWFSDIPGPGDKFYSGDPFCMVHAQASSSLEAQSLVRSRHEKTTELLDSWRTD